MNNDKPTFEELLLDLHLGRLDDDAHADLEAQLQRDPALQARSEQLGKVLRPLDHWMVTPVPENLADKVLGALQPFAHLNVIAAPMEPGPRTWRRLPLFSLRGIIATAASIGIITALAFPAFSSLRSRSHQTRCAHNLGNIFRGISLYQQAFAGALPFAGSLQGASWLPGGRANSPYESNSRHMFLIAKHHYGPSAGDFVCPASSTDRPMQDDRLAEYNDFPRATNISYDTLNMVGRPRGLCEPKPIAYVSDRNPLFVGGRFNASVDASKTNSPTHRGKVQTVLILDGTVIQLTSPVYGPRRDNLWLAGNIRRYTGTETPVAPDDAFLIPGHPVTDLASRRRPFH